VSLFDYQASQELAAEDRPFYALIMAAMRQADTHNALLLRAAFPETWDELHLRYHSPGGILATERCPRCGHPWIEHDRESDDELVAGCNALDPPPVGECLCTETRP
jgi:hypothetical protein